MTAAEFTAGLLNGSWLWFSGGHDRQVCLFRLRSGCRRWLLKMSALLLELHGGDGGTGWGPPAMPPPKGNLILKGSHYPQAAAIRYAVNPSDPIYPGVG